MWLACFLICEVLRDRVCPLHCDLIPRQESRKMCMYLVAQPCLTLATPWTIAYQAPLSMGFSRQEYWSGLPFPSPGDLPNPGNEPRPPALQADCLPTELLRPGKISVIGNSFRTPPRALCSWNQRTPIFTDCKELCTLSGREKHQPYFVNLFSNLSVKSQTSFQVLPSLFDLKTKKTWLRGMRHLLVVGRSSASPVSRRRLSNSSLPRVAEGCHTLLATSVGRLGGDFHQREWWGRWPTWLMLGMRHSG